jgi:hypothetical protein
MIHELTGGCEKHSCSCGGWHSLLLWAATAGAGYGREWPLAFRLIQVGPAAVFQRKYLWGSHLRIR